MDVHIKDTDLHIINKTANLKICDRWAPNDEK